MAWTRQLSTSLAKGDPPTTTPGKQLLHYHWVKSSNSHRNSGNSDTSTQLKCGKINKAAPLSQRSKQHRGGGNPAACIVCIFPTRFTLNLDKKSQKAGLCVNAGTIASHRSPSIPRLPSEGIGRIWKGMHLPRAELDHGWQPHGLHGTGAQPRGARSLFWYLFTCKLIGITGEHEIKGDN